MPSATQQVNKELEVIKVETAPTIARAKALAVEDAQSYAVADSFLSRLVDARKMAKARIGRILDPIKEALKEAQGLFKEIDSPLEQAEIVVRTRMRDFKLEEARQARIEEEKREAAAEELRRQAAAKALAEAKAKTAQMKEKGIIYMSIVDNGSVLIHSLERLASFVDAIVGKRLTYARLIAKVPA